MKISIRNLGMQYKGSVRALDSINLDIESGMFGLLGPNGAGKTTLMRILVTLMKPSEGMVTVEGFDLQKDRGKVRSMIGYLPQDFSTFSKLSAAEFLDYAARLAGVKDSKKRRHSVDEMLEMVGLYEARDRQANKLSGGMKRRLGIAQAVIGDPKILVVDEPTIGLDPEERLRFRNVLADMAHRDIIIILSTHIVGDISSTCNDMALLNHGKLAYRGSPDDLIEQVRGHAWQLVADDIELERIKETSPVISTVPSIDGWEVQIVADSLNGDKGTPIEPNLEHAYVYFLEHTLGERVM